MRVVRKCLVLVQVTLVIALCSCKTAVMVQVQPEYEPQGHRALVTFVRPTSKIQSRFTLWNEDEMIGEIGPESVVQYQTDPGKHLFLCSGKIWSIVDADLRTGNHYVIKVDTIKGSNGYRPVLTPLKRSDDITKTTVYKWLSEYRVFRLNALEFEGATRSQRNKAERAIQDMRAGRLKYHSLDPDQTF